MNHDDDTAKSFSEVFNDELETIINSRKSRLSDEAVMQAHPEEASGEDPFEQAQKLGLIGLAFSGGGIRSATFNLGIIQYFAEKGVLRHFDYLSTVSGGGYIGSWLSAWIHREKDYGGVKAVEAKLRLNSGHIPGERKEEDRSIKFLREYSNYLTPKRGLFNADTWTSVSTYSRNLFLTLLYLSVSLGSVLLVPHVLTLASLQFSRSAYFYVLALAAGLIGLIAVAFLISRNLTCLNDGRRDSLSAPRVVHFGILLPIMALSWMFSLAVGIKSYGEEFRWWEWALGSAGVYLLFTLAGWCVLETKRDQQGSVKKRIKKIDSFTRALWALPAGALGGILLFFLAEWMRTWTMGGHANYLPVTMWGGPLIVLLTTIVVTLHTGFTGRDLSAEMHEWWLRLGGWLSIYCMGWLSLFGFAFYGPLLVSKMSKFELSGSVVIWLVTTLTGVVFGKDPRTGSGDSSSNFERFLRLTPIVFVIGFLVLLAQIIYWLSLGDKNMPAADWSNLAAASDSSFVLFGIVVLATLVLSWRLDINLFSFHYFYRNRLIRCFLGASNESCRNDTKNRNPNPFTGFDPDDDVNLTDLEDNVGPYHIVNAALNLVGGKELAWQHRKAASFVFTPKYCGYETWNKNEALNNKDLDQEAYRPTGRYASGRSLGTAMAISGAAVSPNMGYHSSPAVTFLLTAFNMRLGFWLSNPQHRTSWTHSGPLFSLKYLLAELFGLTNANRPFCYLTDGGHFENLGLYELVRRRCRYIVAVDAGRDKQFKFVDLGNAVRKCRADLNTEIVIDVSGLLPRGDSGYSKNHCAVGSLLYPDGSRGVLVYIKPVLSGNESVDILNFASEHPNFPHESTADQWFDESQFESYRKLGFHVARTVFDNSLQQIENIATEKEELFTKLRYAWYPSCGVSEEVVSRHARTLDSLFERLRQTPQLEFMDAQIYPEWGTFSGKSAHTEELALRLPSDEASRRQGFYFCNSLIQLMESVYLDFNLVNAREHPDNRGWMNLFKHWSWSGMLRATWAVCAPTYGIRFQDFCRQYLGLNEGAIVIEKLELQDTAENELIGRLDDLLAAHPAEVQLNFVEKDRIRIFVNNNLEFFVGKGYLRIYVLRLKVDSLLEFTFGFALVSDDDLAYFRIQDHLRKSGLGRKALRKLLTEYRTIEVLNGGDMSWEGCETFGVAEQNKWQRFVNNVKQAVEQGGVNLLGRV